MAWALPLPQCNRLRKPLPQCNRLRKHKVLAPWLPRRRFLAMERSVPKDNMGRINYLQVAALVQHIVDQTGGGAAGEDAAAAE